MHSKCLQNAVPTLQLLTDSELCIRWRLAGPKCGVLQMQEIDWVAALTQAENIQVHDLKSFDRQIGMPAWEHADSWVLLDVGSFDIASACDNTTFLRHHLARERPCSAAETKVVVHQASTYLTNGGAMTVTW